MINLLRVIFFISLCLTLNAQPSTPKELHALGALKNAQLGISIIDLQNKAEIVRYNSRLNMIPASTMKVLTAASILEKKSPNDRIKTTIYYSGHIEDYTLNGDIYIQAAGDPSWSSRHDYPDVADWKNQFVNLLSKAKISCILGKIVWIVPTGNYGPSDTWAWQDIGNYYGVGHYPIHFKDNSYDIFWDVSGAVGSGARIIKTEPTRYNGILQNQVTIAQEKSGDQSYIYGGPEATSLRIKGTIGKQKTIKITRGALTEPAQDAYLALYQYLQQEKISVGYGFYSQMDLPRSIVSLGSIQSPSIQSLTAQMLYHSDNTLAENLKFQAVGNLSDEELSDWVLEKFSIEDQIHVRDASGLSHFNALTPYALSSILYHRIREHGSDSWDSYLIAGGKGSLRAIFKDLPDGFRIRAKSGSMSQVRCYVGVVYKNENALYAFAIMANHFSGPGFRVAKDMDRYIKAFLATK